MAFDPYQPLDPTDLAILRELQANARITYSELGRRVALTPPAVAERVRRMEDSGVIMGYRVDVDLSKVGYPVMAMVRMRASGDLSCLELGELTRSIPEILECHRVTGEDSYIAKVAVRSVEHLQELIDRLNTYAETITSVVLSSPVTGRAVDAHGALAEEPDPARRRGVRSA